MLSQSEYRQSEYSLVGGHLTYSNWLFSILVQKSLHRSFQNIISISFCLVIEFIFFGLFQEVHITFCHLLNPFFSESIFFLCLIAIFFLTWVVEALTHVAHTHSLCPSVFVPKPWVGCVWQSKPCACWRSSRCSYSFLPWRFHNVLAPDNVWIFLSALIFW